MSDNEASVRITADASAVKPATDVAKGEVAGLDASLQQLTAQFADLAATIRSSMAQSAEATAEMAAEMKEVEAETEKETLSLKEMALQVHEGVESFNGMKAALSEIAEVWMAAFAVEQIADWAKEFAEAAEKTEHLAQTFGMTTTQVQQLQGVAIATGISLDTITRGMQVLDKNAVQAAQGNSAVANAFKAVGISANDGATQMERLETIADKFKDMDDGPKKVALAMELLGRSGAQLIPILNLGSEGLKDLAEKAQEYDVANTAVSQSAQEKGVALAESINESKLAWQGLTNVLGDAFAPMLTEIVNSMNSVIAAMIESYNEGGVVAVVFASISQVIQEVGAVIDTLVAIFQELWSVVSSVVTEIAQTIADLFGVKLPSGVQTSNVWLNVFKDTFTVVKDAVIIACEIIRGSLMVLIDYIRMFADVAHDALTMQWSKIDNDWAVGCDRMAKDVENASTRIQNAMHEAGAAIAAAMNGEALPGAGGGLPEPKGGAGGDFNPSLGASPKEKKPKDDTVQKLQEELTAKKLAWAMEQDAQDSAQQYSLASEAQFWADALNQANLSAKDRAEIEQKYLDVHSQLVKQDIDKVIEGYKTQLDAHKGNSAAQLQIAEQEADFIKQKYGEQSTEYAAAQDQIVKITRQVSEQRRQIEEETAKAIAAMQTADLADEQAAAKFRVSMGVETQAQLLAQERQFENQKYDIQQQALARAKAVTDPNLDPVKYAQLTTQIETAERAHQTRMTQIDQQAALQRTAIERGAINQTASLWATNISKVLTLQEGLGSAIKSLYMGMVDVISGALAKVIENWLTQQITAFAIKHGWMAADGAASVTSSAGQAGAAAFASTAAIPIVGPELAPAAAAAAVSATMAFMPMTMAAGGFDIPSGLNPITQLHQEEMVLPAHLANPLRAMIRSGAANNNAPAAANQAGGDSNSYTIYAMDGADVERVLMRHSTKVAKAADHGIRNGFKPKNGPK